jgi:cytochrome c-type biogenesis protein
MSPDGLGVLAAHTSPAGLAVSFLAGLAFSFNPVAFAAIPVSMAYVTRARRREQAVAFGSMFILGTIAAQTTLGLIAGLGGDWAKTLVGRHWGVVVGALLIVLGLIWTGWLRIPLPRIALRAKRPSGLVGAFLLGAPFAVAVCPVCSPALVVLLGVAAGAGSPWFGATLLFAFALGRAIPMTVGALSLSWLQTLEGAGRFRRAVEVGGGLALAASGLYLLNAYFFWIPSLAG